MEEELLNIDNLIKLESLKEVKALFDLHSDHSTRCNGYISLCHKIKKLEELIDKECELDRNISKKFSTQDIFRDFIRTNFLTSKWEEYCKSLSK